ncbi:MAG: hypothetical protein J0L88_03815 [Xanthomonadales bacterium]|nr:hypothetical protein [Xanthomonadales bacterium]
MPTSLIVVDDFFSDPQALRDAALRLDYPPQQGAFPGRNSQQRLSLPGLAEAVSRIVGEPLKPVEPLQSHAKCRVTLAADEGRAKVHIDQSHWSGILYLSRPRDCRGGTDFFRHRRTGSDRAPIDAQELAAMGYASMAEMHHDIIERDSNDDSAWEPTMQVPMRYNRLVLLRPWLWHTAGAGFGTTLEEARLVFLMFFASAHDPSVR